MADSVENMTIGQLLDRSVVRFGDRVAYEFEGQTLTYGDLAESVDRWARALIASGIEHGDRISLWMSNRIEWVLAYLAVAKIGGVLVPVNTGFRVDEAAYVVGQSDSVMLIVGSQARGRDLVSAGVDVLDAPSVIANKLLVVGGDAPVREGAVSLDEFLSGANSVVPAALAARAQAVRPDDVVLTLYTSGTTGFPKGAMHPHTAIRNMADAADRMELSTADSVVLYLPLYHVFGAAAGVISFMYAGGSIILMETYDVGQTLDLIEGRRASVVYGIDTMYYDQLQHPSFETRDLSAVRLCLAPGRADLLRAVDSRFGTALNVYGMTETMSITAITALDDPLAKRSETVGKPLPGFEAKVVDLDGKSLPPDVPGELVVRGHPVMIGYYKNPEATDAVLDGDGWFRTGDIAVIAEDETVQYRGRIKDMVRVGGENISPMEVERVIMEFPGVAMAVLVGVPDERLGEVGVAFVQVLDGKSITEPELRAFVKERVASFKVPRHIAFTDHFPKTGSGKIQKFKLRERFLETGLGR